MKEELKKQEPLIGKVEMKSMFWRSFLIQSSWSFDKMMAIGCAYAMEKPLRKIYTNDDDYYNALLRHCETFNITPHISTFVFGIAAAMEEENAKGESFDISSINNIKVGLMGPLSGIGDSFYWGTFRVIAAGIGVAFAQQGNIVGSILYFLIYTILHFSGKWIAGKYGYKIGISFLQDSEDNHTLDKLSYGASILGLCVVGAMIGTMVIFTIPYIMNLGGTKTPVQEIFDQIFPGILPLGITFLCVWLFKKNFKTIHIIIGIFIFCILGSVCGIL